MLFQFVSTNINFHSKVKQNVELTQNIHYIILQYNDLCHPILIDFFDFIREIALSISSISVVERDNLFKELSAKYIPLMKHVIYCAFPQLNVDWKYRTWQLNM